MKKILYLIAALVAIPLIAALFIKKDYAVTRSIDIKKPKSEVFEYIKSLRNQDNFSAWSKMDPNMKKSYLGTDGTIGFKASWDSDNKDVGAGEQEIVKIDEGNSISSSLHFIKPFEGLADVNMATKEKSENETTVTWNMKSQMKYPMNFMLLFLNMDDMIGKDFASGLQNLKGIMEQ